MTRALARGEGIRQPHAPTSVHWKGARRGTRTLRRAAGPPQGGLTEVRPRAPCPLGPAPPSGDAQRFRDRPRPPAAGEGNPHRASIRSSWAQNALLQRDRAPLIFSHRPCARVSGTRPQYSRQAVRTRRRGDRINLLQCKCRLLARSRHIAVVLACPLSERSGHAF